MRQAKATNKQILAMKKLGLAILPGITAQAASKRITEALQKIETAGKQALPATDKQRAELSRRGVIFDPSTLTIAEASALIANAIKNDPNALSLAEIRSGDPNGGRGNRQWRKYRCPYCHKGRAERALAVNHENGGYICHRCGEHGLLREYRKAGEIQSYKPLTRIERARIAIQQSADVIFDTLPMDYVKLTMMNYERNGLAQFLIAEFGADRARTAIDRYFIGTDRGSTIFWQIDIERRVRTGKLIVYNPETGKRRKDVRTNWVHVRHRQSFGGSISDEFDFEQCYFGEHLLADAAAGTPAHIVESEKTAVIASIMLPQFIWLATGGKGDLTAAKTARLGRRPVVIYPDADAYHDEEKNGRTTPGWLTLRDEMRACGLDVRISDLIEQEATDQERAAKIDLADWLIEANREQR